MTDDELKVSVDASGASLESRGEGTSRIVDALVGFISPLTESSGYFGDVIRMYRQENVMRGIARANEIAAKLGIEVKPVPPKFLVNWIEGVSLEDHSENGSTVTDLWAGLLVSASQNEKPGHYLYKRLLAEFTSHHANCLRLFMAVDPKFIVDTDAFSLTARSVNEYFSVRERELSETQLQQDQLSEEINDLEGPGIQFSRVALHFSSGSIPFPEELIWEGNSYEIQHFENIQVVDMLTNCGLLKKFSWEQEIHNQSYFEKYNGAFSKRDGLLEVEAFVLTAMGRDFMLSCLGL